MTNINNIGAVCGISGSVVTVANNDIQGKVTEESTAALKKMLRVYLEERNFNKVLTMLHPDITWFGTGKQEICYNTSSAEELLIAEALSWSGHFRITDEWYETRVYNKDSCVIFGEIYTHDADELSLNITKMHLRISAMMVRDTSDGLMKPFHVHMSTPNSNQGNGEFMHRHTVDEKYKQALEDEFELRTRRLKEKTVEFESLANSIMGGVQVCEVNEHLTIIYASDGFFKMVGYTREEVMSIYGNSHIELVHADDRHRLLDIIGSDISEGEYFSIEYRLISKSGACVWVVDKGTRIMQDGTYRFQSIMTDITEHKAQEEALRISEKRYEIALQQLDVTMFEYNILTKELILFEKDAYKYGVSSVIEDGMETFIAKGFILPGSVPGYREMYSRIHAGEPVASCFVTAREVTGELHDYELKLTAVFDSKGVPIRAIGVRSNVAQIHSLEKEQAFGRTLVSDKRLICEVDITNNLLLSLDDGWKVLLKDELESTLMYFSNVLQLMCDIVIAPEHHDAVKKYLSFNYISSVFKSDRKIFTFQYKRRLDREVYRYEWYEATVNIIKDTRENSLHIRFYHMNINDSKIKEQRALEEQRLYESMVQKALLAYEVNISLDLAIRGHEQWVDMYGIEATQNYSNMLNVFAEKVIHHDDRLLFLDTLKRIAVLSEFDKGNRQLICEYRKPNEAGDYVWARCTLHLYEDPENGDIKGYCYVEDIDEQKKAELSLKYKAEHDAMTGIYNKSTIKKVIDSYLSAYRESHLKNTNKHAFMMIDIDHFKEINDSFGHSFGDEVIAEIAGKIVKLFHHDDILGRVGGDEFCVFMKDIRDINTVSKRATALCKALDKQYVSPSGKLVRISASIGIAISPDKGGTYQELFEYADTALYRSKDAGRNRYTF